MAILDPHIPHKLAPILSKDSSLLSGDTEEFSKSSVRQDGPLTAESPLESAYLLSLSGTVSQHPLEQEHL
jgi:hypothetical protein